MHTLLSIWVAFVSLLFLFLLQGIKTSPDNLAKNNENEKKSEIDIVPSYSYQYFTNDNGDPNSNSNPDSYSYQDKGSSFSDNSFDSRNQPISREASVDSYSAYGLPPQPTYGPPQMSTYGPPTYGPPQMSTYGPPAYGPPQKSSYGPPTYGPPQKPTYGPPVYKATQRSSYGPPTYGPPQMSNYGPPQMSNYGPPVYGQSYGQHGHGFGGGGGDFGGHFGGSGGPSGADAPPTPPSIKGSIDYVLIPLILIGIAGPIFVVLYVVLGAFESKLAPIVAVRRSLDTLKPATDMLYSSFLKAVDHGECLDKMTCYVGNYCSGLNIQNYGITQSSIRSLVKLGGGEKYLKLVDDPLKKSLEFITSSLFDSNSTQTNCSIYKCP